METDKVRNAKIQLDKIVGMNIRKERELRKLTREELAEVLGRKATYIGLIERGVRGATPTTLRELAKFFDVPIDSFFDEYDPIKLAYEKSEGKPGGYRMNITTLVTHLTEPELTLLAQTVKGIVEMRKAGN